MPKRILDGDALWKSGTISQVQPPRFRAEYANLLPLAMASGSFECDPRAIWATCYSYNRPDITPEDTVAILDEFERVKLLYRWTVSGHTWGYWVGIEKPGRLPSQARQKERHERTGEPVPQDELRVFLGQEPIGSQQETIREPIGSLGLGLGPGSGLGSGNGNGFGLGSGSGVGSGEGDSCDESVTKSVRERNENQNPPSSQNQNISPRRKKEIQDQKLLQGEVRLYREAHGREPDYLAVLKISEKTHLPFEYAQRLLSEPAMQGRGETG